MTNPGISVTEAAKILRTLSGSFKSQTEAEEEFLKAVRKTGTNHQGKRRRGLQNPYSTNAGKGSWA